VDAKHHEKQEKNKGEIMPLYDFKCKECGKIKEARIHFEESKKGIECECGGNMVRQFSKSVAIHNFERPYKPGHNATEDRKRAFNNQVEKKKLPDNYADLKIGG